MFLPAYVGSQFVNLGPLGTALNQLLPRVSLTSVQQAELLKLAGYLQSSLQASLGKLACSEQVCWVVGEAVVYGPVEVTAQGHSLVAFTPDNVLALVEGNRGTVKALAAPADGKSARMQVRTPSGWFNGQTAIGEKEITVLAAPPPPEGFAADSIADSIIAGAYHTCALTADGTAYCWGGNSSGQLGTGGTTSSNIPKPVLEAMIGFTSIAAGHHHTCGLEEPGKQAYCWGFKTHRQLGDGSTATQQTTPRAVVSPQ